MKLFQRFNYFLKGKVSKNINRTYSCIFKGVTFGTILLILIIRTASQI